MAIEWGLANTHIGSDIAEQFEKGRQQSTRRSALAMYATDPQGAVNSALSGGDLQAATALQGFQNDTTQARYMAEDRQVAQAAGNRKLQADEQAKHLAHARDAALYLKSVTEKGGDPLKAYDEAAPVWQSAAGWTPEEIAQGRELANNPQALDAIIGAASEELEFRHIGDGYDVAVSKRTGKVVQEYRSPTVKLGQGEALFPNTAGSAGAPIAAPASDTTVPVGPGKPVTANAQDRDAMIRMVAGEAGNQGPEGMAAVAHVALNRAATGYGGQKSIYGVVTAPNQFQGLRSQVDPKQYAKAAQIVDSVLAGQMGDPTGGAINFINPELQAQNGDAMPKWASNGQRIGAHVFYGGGRGPDVATTATPASATVRSGAPAGALLSNPKTDDQWIDLPGGGQINRRTGKKEGVPKPDGGDKPYQVPAGANLTPLGNNFFRDKVGRVYQPNNSGVLQQSSGVTDEAVKSSIKTVTSVNDLLQAISRFDQATQALKQSEFGVFGQYTGDPNKVARAKAAATDLQINLKGPAAYNLGVLTGPDLEILEGVVADPAKMLTGVKKGLIHPSLVTLRESLDGALNQEYEGFRAAGGDPRGLPQRWNPPGYVPPSQRRRAAAQQKPQVKTQGNGWRIVD